VSLLTLAHRRVADEEEDKVVGRESERRTMRRSALAFEMPDASLVKIRGASEHWIVDDAKVERRGRTVDRTGGMLLLPSKSSFNSVECTTNVDDLHNSLSKARRLRRVHHRLAVGVKVKTRFNNQTKKKL
jgi:hypothetical protein